MQKKSIQRIAPFIESFKPLIPQHTGVKEKIEPKLANIKSIVFDIYGTLLISASGDIDKAVVSIDNLTTAMNVAGYLWKSKEHEIKYGKLLLDNFHENIILQQTKLIKEGHPHPEIDIISVWDKTISVAIHNDWITHDEDNDIVVLSFVFEILSNPVWPMPEMKNVLQQIKKRGIIMGIVSNAQFYTPVIMNYFLDKKIEDKNEISFFKTDISLFSYQQKRSKPDTFLFEELAVRLKNNYAYTPDEVLFVGNDMLKDIWAANQVGFKTVLFAGDKRSLRMREDDKRCSGLEPDFIVTELKQLLLIV